jgi:hypothetical protein
MESTVAFAIGALFATLAAACGKDSQASTKGTPDGTSPAPAERGLHLDPRQTAAIAPRDTCAHAVCGNDFFVDVDSSSACTAGAPCTVSLTLVATGAYHVNDAYPYKFIADDAPGIEFLGTGEAGKNVFSKLADDWRKKDEKTGTMTVKWQPASKGPKTVSGVFKLSVCSAQACQLEGDAVSTTVAVR